MSASFDFLVVRVLGADLLNRRLAAFAKRIPEVGVTRGLDLSAADLLERSANLAPILTGDLIRSGRIIRQRRGRGRIVRIISYGTDHAVFTHEGFYRLGPVSSRKPATSDGPVGRKYLERPFRIHSKRYVELIRSEAEKAINQGRRLLRRSVETT